MMESGGFHVKMISMSWEGCAVVRLANTAQSQPSLDNDQTKILALGMMWMWH